MRSGVTVPWAFVGLGVEIPPPALRVAVTGALGDSCHVDWHGHCEGGNRPGLPVICYRHRGLWLWGERIDDRLREIAGVDSLRVGSEIVPVALDVRRGETSVGVRGKTWRTYSAFGVFPSSVQWGRRPRDRSPERTAWVGSVIAASIREWLDDAEALHVHVERWRDVPVVWREESASGFDAVLVTNAELPPGFAVGSHRSEGFGEVVPC